MMQMQTDGAMIMMEYISALGDAQKLILGGWEKNSKEQKKCKGYALPEGRILNKTHPDSCPAGQSGLNWPMESL